MPPPLHVIVTGSNRGIGKAICDLILSRQPSPPLRLFAASRQGINPGLPSEHVSFPRLDISNDESINTFAEEIKRRAGTVDVLINNAGVNLDAQYGPETARKTLDVNYRGTLKMCQMFIPLLSPNGRIVNMSSIASQLSAYSKEIQARFRNPKLTLEDLEALVQEYENSIPTHSESTSGFSGPGRSYAISKASVNAFTRILALQNPNTTINACCPGWVHTDMGLLVGSKKVPPPKNPEEGALVPYHVAFEDIGGVSGKYWANDSIRGRGVGKVQEW